MPLFSGRGNTVSGRRCVVCRIRSSFARAGATRRSGYRSRLYFTDGIGVKWGDGASADRRRCFVSPELKLRLSSRRWTSPRPRDILANIFWMLLWGQWALKAPKGPNMNAPAERIAIAVFFSVFGLFFLTSQAFAQPVSGLACNRCVQGYVWREASPVDHVCVTAKTRSQTADDNTQAAARRQPGGGAYGPDTCRQGYVWRDAFSGDHVCVPGETRAQAAADNARAAERCADDREVPGSQPPSTPGETVTPISQKNEFFWTTLPGILTALAGFIIALTGLVKVLKSRSK